MLNISSTWIGVSVGTCNYWQSRPLEDSGAVENVLADIKFMLMKCLFIITWSGMEFLSVHTDTNLKDLGRANVGAVPWKPVSRLRWYDIFLVFFWGNSPPNFSRNFIYTLYNQTTSPLKLFQNQLGCYSFNYSDGRQWLGEYKTKTFSLHNYVILHTHTGRNRQ